MKRPATSEPVKLTEPGKTKCRKCKRVLRWVIDGPKERRGWQCGCP